METTIEEKNIAIAEMLGAEKQQWYPPNTPNKSTGVYYRFPKEMAERLPSTFLQVSGDYGLKFHSDANWQNEAIEWVEKQGWHFSIDHHTCKIYDVVSKGPGSGHYSEIIAPSRKEAIFEAIYLFSQKLKQTKHSLYDKL